ncbi:MULTISPECIES: DUF397 domain-containing protein [Streptomyces]|uniref:DUF397 domain-containing protein n=2 Tax=Streptomyces TaxID=1883 RepID=UPI0004AA23FC|nr:MULTISPECIES: DUF397 domain-containing protein [Streptomyces]KOG49628.1 hypothetical protein ADK74_04085 [Streptomyces decoyicus]MCL7495572.1 DUF397 domain-containing protein [Streptomyces sp. MCA2]QZY16555.1 DUF397 domain-containing protein [Streptomyces decoyicus]BDH09467.1 hypothetical protein HOK021_06460 [Streptomyces hygroscopicus]
MTRKLNTTLMWQKSTYSGKDGNCVEIARLDESAVAVRDSKAPRGPVLSFSEQAWTALLSDIDRGRLGSA